MTKAIKKKEEIEYKGNHECVINGDKLEEMFEAKQGEPFDFDKFNIGGLDFQVIIYPNGYKKSGNDEGSFTVFIKLLSFPKQWDKILVCRRILCVESGVDEVYCTEFKKMGTWSGWESDTMRLEDIQKMNINQLTFKITMSIIRFEWSSEKEFGKEVYKLLYPQNIPFAKSYKFAWKLNGSILQRIKEAINGNEFCSPIWDNMWCISMNPNGNSSNDDGWCYFALRLCGLPRNVKKMKIKVSFQVFLDDENQIINEDKTVENMHCTKVFRWGSNKLSFQDLRRCNSLDISVKIKIINQRDHYKKHQYDSEYLIKTWFTEILKLHPSVARSFLDEGFEDLEEFGDITKNDLGEMKINDKDQQQILKYVEGYSKNQEKLQKDIDGRIKYIEDQQSRQDVNDEAKRFIDNRNIENSYKILTQDTNNQIIDNISSEFIKKWFIFQQLFRANYFDSDMRVTDVTREQIYDNHWSFISEETKKKGVNKIAMVLHQSKVIRHLQLLREGFVDLKLLSRLIGIDGISGDDLKEYGIEKIGKRKKIMWCLKLLREKNIDLTPVIIAEPDDNATDDMKESEVNGTEERKSDDEHEEETKTDLDDLSETEQKDQTKAETEEVDKATMGKSEESDDEKVQITNNKNNKTESDNVKPQPRSQLLDIPEMNASKSNKTDESGDVKSDSNRSQTPVPAEEPERSNDEMAESEMDESNKKQKREGWGNSWDGTSNALNKHRPENADHIKDRKLVTNNRRIFEQNNKDQSKKMKGHK